MQPNLTRLQVIGNKWDTYLDLLQAEYTEGYVYQLWQKRKARSVRIHYTWVLLAPFV
jgi:hypothetical protein